MAFTVKSTVELFLKLALVEVIAEKQKCCPGF
jgi:hypothetical protein